MSDLHFVKEMLFTARPIPAGRMAAYGVLNGVVPVQELEATTADLAADIASVRDEIVAVLATDDAQRELRRMSPHENLAGLRANVFLLHGEGDTVIPATETQWLAADVPPARLRMALITPAIQHVELHAPSLAERAALVHFMGEVLADASAMR